MPMRLASLMNRRPSDLVTGRFFIDGHVHFYPHFDLHQFLDSALANFRNIPDRPPSGIEYAGWLLFAESAALNYFQHFQDSVGSPSGGKWAFRETAEPTSLVAQRDPEAKLFLLAGRQVVSAEGLEVLALCSHKKFDDGRPLSAVVEAAQACDAIVVLPWGFGKWWFRRGACITDFLKRVEPTDVFLGDNGGRARVGSRPHLFRVAEERGVRILSGSDPLPLHSEVKRVGRYGFTVAGAIDPLRPAAGLKRILRTRNGQPIPYGRLIGPMGFCRNQLMHRVNTALQRWADHNHHGGSPSS